MREQRSEGGRQTKKNTKHDVDKMTPSDKRPQENMQSYIVTGSVTGSYQASVTLAGNVNISGSVRLVGFYFHKKPQQTILLLIMLPSFWLYYAVLCG